MVDLFVTRSQEVGGSAHAIIEKLVERLRAQTGSASARSLDRFLEVRSLVERRCDSGITCDRYIEPIGADFADGFGSL